MFGTLKPHSCSLVHDERHEYNTFYCGLCKSLGDGYGTLSRALVSHDSVFLALVADGLLDEPAAPDRCRCPLLPVVHRPTVRPDSTAMRYASAIQMMLGDQWLADRAIEGKALAKVARPLAQGHVRAAKEALSELGISLAPLDGFEARQARCEIVGETGPDEAARPTMDALGYVFTQIAMLPGAGEKLRSDEVRRDLEALGRAVGGVIYWADALDDLKKDYLAGDFNPCLVRLRGGELVIASARVERCAALLREALATIAAAAARLPWQRHREVVENILCTQLPRMARKATADARAVASEGERARLAAIRALPWYSRTARQALVFVVVLWTWLVGLRAVLAQDKGKRPPSIPPRAAPAAKGPKIKGVKDAGADAAIDDAGAADASVPSPVREPESQPMTKADDAGADAGDDAGAVAGDDAGADGGTGKGVGLGGSECPTCGSLIKNVCCCDVCGDVCGGCQKALEGCTQSTSGCCKGCGDCGNCCKGCDGCGGCGKGCDGCGGCGNCGNCCNGCGNGCNGCGNCGNCGGCGGGGCCK